MALPATDNFNRADGALGANWTGGPGDDLQIHTNAVSSATGSPASMFWNPDTPNNAQYSQLKITVPQFSGPAIRHSATDFVMLDAQVDTGWVLIWYNGGAYTQIGSSYATAPVANDVGRITANGSAFEGFVNTVSRCSGSNAGAPASGNGGIWAAGTYLDPCEVDDFEVGNLGAAFVPEPPKVSRQSIIRASYW